MKKIRINESSLNALIRYGLIKEQSKLDEYGSKGLWKSEWNNEDQMLAMYNSLYGIEDLGINKQEAAENIIGTSLASFNQQSSNFDFLSGKGGLSRPHEMQSSIWSQYKDMPRTEFKSLCLEIIHKRQENPENAVVKKKLGNEIGTKRDEITKSREDALRRKGVDPNRVKMIGSRPLNPPADEIEPEIKPQSSKGKNDIIDFLKSIYERATKVNTKEDARGLSNDIKFLIDYIDNENDYESVMAEITNLFKNRNTLTEIDIKIKRISDINKKINF
jgi:hypothetical protein